MLLRMGLYDDPLPPRPPPVDKSKSSSRGEKARAGGSDAEQEEEEEYDEDIDVASTSSSGRLFEFDANGREKRDLLPPLSRKLDKGIDCYFVPTDRLVRNLVDKTGVNVQDACWALEATKGDITEAWTCIGTARRVLLNQDRLPGTTGEGGDDETTMSGSGSRTTNDMDVYELEIEEEFEERRQLRKEEEKRRNVNEIFKGEADEQWLPGRPSPNPVDDEPWFTG